MNGAAFRAGDWPPEIRALVDAVRAEWSAVDKVWAELTRDRDDIHLLRQTGKEPRSFLAAAFTMARERELLQAFATRLVKEDLVDEGHEQAFNAALERLLGRSPFELQRFQNGVFAPVNALLAFRGALHACELVCRIDIDGQQVGTGVLVRPNLVATAAHVVLDLLARTAGGALDLAPNGSPRAAAGSLARLTVTFGDFDRVTLAAPGTVTTGTPVSLHPDWLAWGSPPTPLERLNALSKVRDIHGIAPPNGPWDLALIRLAEGRKLAPPPLVADPPAAPSWVHLLHHPHGVQRLGEPLLWSTGTLDEALGQPPVRYLHDANTLGGSSGAPVFDTAWRVIALHQGGCRSLQQADDAGGLPPAARNRAVPVRYWSERLDALALADDTPYVRELRDDPARQPYPYPVIGRRETQQRLWRGLQEGAPPGARLLIVRGAPGTGLRFTKRLVRAMVEPHGGVVATLDLANAAGEDAVGFARRIAGALSASLSEPLSDDAFTTVSREVRQQVAPALYRTWEELASRRPVWLVLEALDRVPPAVADLVAGLLRRLPEYPLLHLVLVAWTDAPPPGFESSVEDLDLPTALDIAYHLTPPGEEPSARHIAAAESVLALQPDGGYGAAHRVVAVLGPALAAAIAPGGPS